MCCPCLIWPLGVCCSHVPCILTQQQLQYFEKITFFIFCDVFRHCRCHLHHDHHHHEVEELQRLIVYSEQIIIQLCHQSHNHRPRHENHHVGEIMKSVSSHSAHFPFLSPFNFYFWFWLSFSWRRTPDGSNWDKAIRQKDQSRSGWSLARMCWRCKEEKGHRIREAIINQNEGEE